MFLFFSFHFLSVTFPHIYLPFNRFSTPTWTCGQLNILSGRVAGTWHFTIDRSLHEICHFYKQNCHLPITTHLQHVVPWTPSRAQESQYQWETNKLLRTWPVMYVSDQNTRAEPAHSWETSGPYWFSLFLWNFSFPFLWSLPVWHLIQSSRS